MLTVWLTVLSLCGTAQVYATLLGYTNGTCGEVCGPHTCLAAPRSACQAGQCVCQSPYSQGVGSFLCVKPNDTWCGVFNDPMVRGFDGSHAKVPLYNKFLVSHIRSEMCEGSRAYAGICDIQFFAWGGRHGMKSSKSFIRGIHVHVVITILGGTTIEAHFKVITHANAGLFHYQYDEPTIVSVPGCGNIGLSFDDVNNFALLDLGVCGVEIGIRGAEMDGDPLQLPAGTYVRVFQECGNEITFMSQNHSVCAPPPGKGPGLDEVTRELCAQMNRTVKKDKVAMYRAYTSRERQDYPGAPVTMQSFVDTLFQCNLKPAFCALDLCQFLLQPKFLTCFDPTPDAAESFGLMDACCDSVCYVNELVCRDIQARIAGCRSKIHDIDSSIANYNCSCLPSI